MKRQTKIIATLGPASSSSGTINEMAKSGLDIARINFSHGNADQHQLLIDTIRTVNKENNRDIKILQDLEGYRIRIGTLAEPIDLLPGSTWWMCDERVASPKQIPLEFEDISTIEKGMSIFVDDGNLFMKVIQKQKKQICVEVQQGGLLKSRKGVNIPELKLKMNILTDKDRRDLAFGIKNNVDFVAQSFVRNKNDIARVMRIVKPVMPECTVIAKIENKQGVRNIESIIRACDGIMVARGDLGVSLPIYEIPFIQKDIIRRCNRQKKIVITATQMLESMTEHIRPTRAEVTDVANAILDGTDCVMLSAETAVGRFPVKTIMTMAQIINFTEKKMMYMA